MTNHPPLQFTKGHGTENDFIVLPDPDGELSLDAALVRALCDRRSGLGADGVLRVVRSVNSPDAADSGAADWFMDYRNADGSIAEMCGNGIRVFGRYLVDAGLIAAGEVPVATRAGVRTLRVPASGDVVVDMGPPVFTGGATAVVAGRPYVGVGVSMGNPHLVCTTDTPVGELDLTGQPIVDDALFPDGVNVELVNVLADAARGGTVPSGADLHVRMRVHERGVGETRSCGTGACAVGVATLAAAQRTTGSVVVDVPGGRVRTTVTENTSFLAGPAVLLASGSLEQSWLDALRGQAVVPA